ncbi:DUF445 domain-containing protein [Achromobacter sp. F4_2707]|uniref:DUF445 domain-containing protein n=1 Tax=Achromobacter sp. F4_2707 TaxID=3114286 RepID=UPI0039C66E2B
MADTELKRRKLRNARRRATGLLALFAVIYVLATHYGHLHASLAWVAAFSEAAMVGALADWYAVVALFRHPLGLKRLPHTAIIPRKKDRIADNLGEFIQGEFFSNERIIHVIDNVDPAMRAAHWLRNADNAERVAAWLRNGLRNAGGLLNENEVRTYLQRSVSRHVLSTDLAALTGRILASLTRSGRHQEVLDLLLRYGAGQLKRPELQQSLNDIFAEKLPFYFQRLKHWVGTKGGEFTARTLADLLEEVEQNPDHPLRQHFEDWLQEFILKLQTDPDYRWRLEQLTQKLAQHPALYRYVDNVWREWRDAAFADLNAEHSRLEAFLSKQISRFGEVLEHDEAMREWVNQRIREQAPKWADRYRHRLSQFIAEKMKEWNESELVEKLELNIGTELQYIRINGAIVGGLVGLIIHAVSRYL